MPRTWIMDGRGVTTLVGSVDLVGQMRRDQVVTARSLEEAIRIAKGRPRAWTSTTSAWSHAGQASASASATFGINLDPKKILHDGTGSDDLFNAATSSGGKQVGLALFKAAMSIMQGDNTGAVVAIESAVTAAVTAANPIAGVIVGAALSLVPIAHGSGGIPDPVCDSWPDGRKGYPTQYEIADWSMPGVAGIGGAQDLVGTFPTYLHELVSREPDPFLKAVALALAYQEGKRRNCYIDYVSMPAGTNTGNYLNQNQVDRGKVVALTLATWNAAMGNGPMITVTRTIAGIEDKSQPIYWGGKLTGYGTTTPADWDDLDKAPPVDVTILGSQTRILPYSWASILYDLWAYEQRVNGNTGLTYDKSNPPKVTVQVRDSSHVPVHMKFGVVSKPTINLSPAMITLAPGLAPKPAPSPLVWVPAAAGLGAALYFANPLLGLLGLGVSLILHGTAK